MAKLLLFTNLFRIIETYRKEQYHFYNNYSTSCINTERCNIKQNADVYRLYLDLISYAPSIDYGPIL